MSCRLDAIQEKQACTVWHIWLTPAAAANGWS